jgi:hypothetical protein
MEIIQHVDAKLNGTSSTNSRLAYADHAEPNDVTGFIAAPPVDPWASWGDRDGLAYTDHAEPNDGQGPGGL